MARTHYVAKRRVGSRGEHALNCLTCGKPIEYGQPYKWFKQKQSYGGVKKSYHPECEIPMRDRSTSRLVTIWEAQAALDLSACDSLEGLKSALEDFAQVVRDVEAEYRESVENMEQGFGHRTYQADELEERAEALEQWADELEAWEFSEGEPDEDDFQVTGSGYGEALTEWENNEPTLDDAEENEELREQQQDEHDEWESDEPDESDFQELDDQAYQDAVDAVLDEARDEAASLADECPV